MSIANLNTYPPNAVPQWLSLGSNSWILTATTLVMIQSVPALAMFYAGMTRRKFSMNTVMMVLFSFASTFLVWTLLGYSLSFYSSSLRVDGMYLLGLPIPIWNLPIFGETVYGPAQTSLNIPFLTFVMFQFAFAAITPGLIVGAVTEKMNFKAWMLFSPAWIVLVYAPVAYWLFAGGWLNQLGAVDYSGGYVIHMTAGYSALALAMVVGQRLPQERKIEAHNLLLTAIGFGLDWMGWNGFNGGDAGGATIDAAIAVFNTNLAAAAAAITWLALDMKVFGKSTFTGLANGAFTGLVAITPMAGLVNPSEAFITGIIAAPIVWIGLYRILPRLGVDDSLGVFPVHGIGGTVGGLLTGLMIDPTVSSYYLPGYRGALFGDWHQFLVQALAVLVVGVYSFLITFGLGKLLGKITPLRLGEKEMMQGDYAIHGETAYPDVVQMEPDVVQIKIRDSGNGKEVKSSKSGEEKEEEKTKDI
ncbi:ammonium transporter [Metallosphaera tengchongensis]|uniref:Ammonium transporter n=1 Tax=Metallosphaera tengchongensis TaxID=1532350 RepID=A0A6N0NR78_9CREN|nr:ammonium transporter [Metallosphaera tengchongensis]QKQ99211.1 ammonium transporter [Metallosphaera tengchongensis]